MPRRRRRPFCQRHLNLSILLAALIAAFDTVEIKTTAHLSVYPRGYVFYSRPLVHKIPCEMSVRQFPFDTQRCSFTLGSWSYHGGVVDVLPRLVRDTTMSNTTVPNAMTLETYQVHTEFALMQVTTDHYNHYYSCCPEPYPLITYKLRLRRTPLPYFNGIVLPLILTTISGFFAFFINPKAGERIGLGITVLLTVRLSCARARGALEIVTEPAVPPRTRPAPSRRADRPA